MKELNAIYPSSHWGSNIGNVFFHLGGIHLLHSAKKNLIIHQADLHSEKAFFPNKAQIRNDSKYGNFLGAADILVLDGPMFDENFSTLFEPMLKNAKKLKLKTFLISTGGITYSKKEIAHCREILKKYPPYVLTTRDSDTYDNYKDLAENSYNGICTAWFCPDYYPGYNTPLIEKYISLTFDHTCEPSISNILDNLTDPKKWGDIDISPVKHSKMQKLLRLTQRDFPNKIEAYETFRPTHQVLHRANWRLYFKKKIFLSQTPYGYLYRNTSLTVTDRLHACVATLAYGNPARLFIKSKRARLLNRMNIADVTNKISTIDKDLLKKEKTDFISWMKMVMDTI
jgi:hypothetical protein